MAKVVLVWNSDVNESPVTYPLAKLLSKALQARGHEVEIVKVPFARTMHAAGMTGKKYQWLDERFREGISKKNPRAMIIDLHTTNDRRDDRFTTGMLEPVYGQAKKNLKKPKNWRAYAGESIQSEMGQLELIKQRDNQWVVEVPAVYASPHKNLKRHEGWEDYEFYRHWFKGQADLAATMRKNYLSEIVIRKLVHQIHETATGVKPRKAPNQSRGPYSASNPPSRLYGKSAKSRRKFQRRR